MKRAFDTFVGSDEEYCEFLEDCLLQYDPNFGETTRRRFAVHQNGLDSTSPASTQGHGTPDGTLQDPTSETSPPQTFRFIAHDQHVDQRRRDNPKTWPEVVNSIVKQTPSAEDWWQKFVNEGIDVLISSKDAHLVLAGRGAEIKGERDLSLSGVTADIRSEGRRSTDTVLDQGFGGLESAAIYAYGTASLGLGADEYLHLRKLKELILLSACAVLRHEGEPVDQLHQVIELYFTEKRSAGYYTSLIKTAILLNKVLYRLCRSGWGDYSLGLYLLWGKHVRYFSSLPTSTSDSIDALFHRLPVPGIGSAPQSLPEVKLCFIPYYVCMLLQRRFSMSQISRILGYEDCEAYEQRFKDKETSNILRILNRDAMISWNLQ